MTVAFDGCQSHVLTRLPPLPAVLMQIDLRCSASASTTTPVDKIILKVCRLPFFLPGAVSPILFDLELLEVVAPAADGVELVVKEF